MGKFLQNIPFLLGTLLIAKAGVAEESICPPKSNTLTTEIASNCSYDLWGDISFIYWQPFQDNMEIGLALESVSTVFSHGILQAVNTNQSKYVNMDFDFMPGFKIGMGINALQDHWDFRLEYTRLHGEDQKYSAGGAFGLAPAFADNAAMELLLGAAILPYGTGNAAWNIKFDLLDADFGRLHSSGCKFSLHSYFGIRGAWIHQRLHGFYANPSNGVLSTLTITSVLGSWGLGPRIGIDSQWNVSQKLRLYGSAEADLLYTRYHWNYKSTAISPALLNTPSGFSANESGIDTVRAHIDLELGLGWGSYFHKSNCRFDLSAGYGFQVFYNQNMFKYYFTTADVPFNYAPISNLYVQGMTLKAKFDF